jgi:hypothetical protein
MVGRRAQKFSCEILRQPERIDDRQVDVSTGRDSPSPRARPAIYGAVGSQKLPTAPFLSATRSASRPYDAISRILQ